MAFAVRVTVPPQDSPYSTTWQQHFVQGVENTRLGCMHTHTINKIYNLWIPLTVWTATPVMFLKTHFARYFSLIQSTMQHINSLSEPQHLFSVLHVQVSWLRATRPSFCPPLWYTSVPSHTCCSGFEISLIRLTKWFSGSLTNSQTKIIEWKLPMKCTK